jgi:hypothetical protein
MSYTGNQIYSNFVRRKTPTLKPDTNIDKYFLISYISNVAKTKLSNISNSHFFNSTITVYSYIDQLKTTYSDSEKDLVDNVLKMFDYTQNNPFFTMGRKACSCSAKYTPIYFDHKIADELSTFNKLLFTGSYPIPTNTNTCEINPLINGCIDISNLKSLFTDNPCVNNSTLDSEVPCFPSFYKTISYTINGNVMDNNENIVSLLIRTTGGKNKRSNPRKTNKKLNSSKKKSRKVRATHKHKRTNKRSNKRNK